MGIGIFLVIENQRVSKFWIYLSLLYLTYVPIPSKYIIFSCQKVAYKFFFYTGEIGRPYSILLPQFFYSKSGEYGPPIYHGKSMHRSACKSK